MITEKKGLMIGFISDGKVPVSWMMRVNDIGNHTPPGIFWKLGWFEGKGYKENKQGYANARNQVVEKAKAMNAKWLFFIDADVYPDPNVITKLMSYNKSIVSGIYYMKCMPPQPVIFKKMGDGPYWDFPVDELFEIEGSGCGCVLISMDVFDAFDKAKLPYFKENWMHEKEDGSKVKVNIGEDHWFYITAKKLGFQPYCSSSVMCDHIDVNTGVVYPGQEEVERIRRKVLEKHGRQDILKKDDEIYHLNPDKKTIIFYNATPSPFAGDELERRGVGGSEGDIINLARIFAKMYNVIVFCNCPRPGIYDGVRYLHHRDTDWMQKFHTDLIISSRNTQFLANVNFKEYFRVDKVCLWTHDLPQSYVFDKLPQALKNIDRIFALTQWHKKSIMNYFPDIPENKFFIARNGVDTKLYKENIERNPYKLIYSSTPFRGLDVLLHVFPEIKKRVPQAELHIFSSMKVYGYPEKDSYEFLYEKARTMEGVHYHGTITRKELAKEMMSSAILAYPNHYDESCCITAMEAVTAGTPIVTSNRAALPEIIPKGCAILIDGDSNTKEYQEQFVDKIVNILKHKELWQEMHNACKGHDFTWETISKEWIKEFFPDDIARFSDIIDNVTDEIQVSNYIYPAENPPENINTPDYWDSVYEKEDSMPQIDFKRSDSERWDMIIEKIPDGSVVLDYGSGPGEFLFYLQKKKPKCKLYAVDFSIYAINKIRNKDMSIRVTNRIEGFPEDTKKNYFNIISCQHAIEHMDNPEKLINDLKNLLAEDGLLILAIPINDDPWKEHLKVWQAEDVTRLLDKFDCIYELHIKDSRRKKKDGSFRKEAIVFIKFKR